ncbi:MAG: hypothetical protein QXY45_00305 [Candidatus Aenigmatarchaeota archaeon]
MEENRKKGKIKIQKATIFPNYLEIQYNYLLLKTARKPEILIIEELLIYMNYLKILKSMENSPISFFPDHQFLLWPIPQKKFYHQDYFHIF